MSQSIDPDFAKARKLFGAVWDTDIHRWLEARGYREVGWCWIKPTPEHIPTEEELFAIGFLIDKWGYGRLMASEASP